VACWAFADFGDNFEVTDTNGEDPRTVQIDMISNANPAVVRTGFNHRFPSGAPVTFKDIAGMSQLNNRTCTVTKIDDTSFSIDVDSSSWPAFGGYGEVVEIKTSTFIKHVRSFSICIFACHSQRC